MSEPASVRALSCSRCGAPTAYLAASCTYCGSPLTWHDVPTLRRGKVIQHYDLRQDTSLPGVRSIVGMQHLPGQGAVLPIEHGRSLFLTAGVQRADAAIRIEATALHRTVGFGLEVRVTKAGQARSSYAVRYVPAARAFRVDRQLSTGAELHVESLRAIETLPQLGGVGEPVELEVRCADAILSIHAMSRGRALHLGTLVDARYGFGAYGFTVNGLHGAGEILVHSVSVHEVA